MAPQTIDHGGPDMAPNPPAARSAPAEPGRSETLRFGHGR